MRRVRIGMSACFLHGDATRPIFKGKTLLYLEQSLAHWIQSEGALAYLVPSVNHAGSLTLKDVIADIDGLVLQGGSDVAPETYGETALKMEWAGDALRDRYEIELLRECLGHKKPILGICRGAQLLNVALGGTLYQDISTQLPGSRIHRNWEAYDQLFHDVRIHQGSMLEQLYKGAELVKVNSVHHQGIRELAKGLKAEASAVEDGIVEAIRLDGVPFVFAFQWHPEFQDPSDRTLLDCKPMLRQFLKEAAKARLD